MTDKQNPNPIVFFDITIGTTVIETKNLSFYFCLNLLQKKGSWKDQIRAIC
jgi:hypothetical protein